MASARYELATKGLIGPDFVPVYEFNCGGNVTLRNAVDAGTASDLFGSRKPRLKDFRYLMDSFDGEGTMSFAHYGSHEDHAEDEARQRINSARVRDLTFLIRRSSKDVLSDQNVELLAKVLARLEVEQKGSVARTAINDALRAEGLSDGDVERLVGAVFNRS